MKVKKIMASMICIMLLAGCGKSDEPQDILLDAKEKMAAAQSYDFDIHIVIDASLLYEGSSIPQKAEYKLNIKENQQTAYTTGEILTTSGAQNKKHEIEAYQTTMNENYSIYFNDEGIWYRQDAESMQDFGSKLIKMFYDANMPFSGDALINEKECYQMQAEVYGELSNQYLSIFGISATENEKAEIELCIYKDTKLPAYAKIDLKQTAHQVVKNDEMELQINKMSVEITFNSFNETDISVPEDIKKDAVKKQDNSAGIIQEVEKEQGKPDTPTSENYRPSNEGEIPEAPSAEKEKDKLSDSWEDMQFDYNGKVYSMPFPYKDFEDSGFKAEDSVQIIEPGKEIELALSNGTSTINVSIKNTSDMPKTLFECVITRLSMDSYSMDEVHLSKFMFNAGANFASTYDEIVSLWGEPTEAHDGAAIKNIKYHSDKGETEISFNNANGAIEKYSIMCN